MHTNPSLIEEFYRAFAGRDHTTMAAAYSDLATFSDPVFPHLDVSETRSMWKMFCTGGNDVEISHSDVQPHDDTVTAHWEAVYRFPKTGRRVHNKIDATFWFEDGLIVRHVDDFNFYRWSRMALGAPGILLGWTPLIREKVRQQAAAQLRNFRSREV